MGAMSYSSPRSGLARSLVGLVLALQGQQMILPSYFIDSKTLFPIWPVIDPGAAMRLFLATMAVVLLPKALGLALEIKRARRARELFGMPRAIAGVMTETVFSMLIRADPDDDADGRRCCRSCSAATRAGRPRIAAVLPCASPMHCASTGRT